ERLSRVRKGDIVVEPFDDKELIEVPSGLIHDWIGAAFISGATLDQTLGLVQQYDRHRDYYQPEVVDSKLVSRNGDQFHIFLRLLKKKVLTVILNTEHDVRYTRLDARRAYSISRSTKIAEVEDAGKPQERELPAGSGHGFLWRLNSYWRFQERDGGVYVECEAISLTRDVPTGLGWMIGPIVKSLPRESLENTLRATRQAVKAQRATAPRAESGKQRAGPGPMHGPPETRRTAVLDRRGCPWLPSGCACRERRRARERGPGWPQSGSPRSSRA